MDAVWFNVLGLSVCASHPPKTAQNKHPAGQFCRYYVPVLKTSLVAVGLVQIQKPSVGVSPHNQTHNPSHTSSSRPPRISYGGERRLGLYGRKPEAVGRQEEEEDTQRQEQDKEQDKEEDGTDRHRRRAERPGSPPLVGAIRGPPPPANGH